MNISKKSLKLLKTGFINPKSKLALNYWRFIFNAFEENTSEEKTFFIELEFINPSKSPSKVMLGFEPRVKVSGDDLQYVLAGTVSAKSLETEDLVQPSYCAVRIGTIGKNSKQLCEYIPIKNFNFNKSPFELSSGNNLFTEKQISGFINVSEEDLKNNPGLMCNSGYANWNISYDFKKNYDIGYFGKKIKWFPCGLKTFLEGKIGLDGKTYVTDSRRSVGYSDRFFGNSFPKKWFHISSNNLTSNISGKILFDSTFVVHGIYENRVSFIANIDNTQIELCADVSKSKYFCTWDCVQSPNNSEDSEEKLHWTVSLNNKEYVVDIDIYCNLKDLFNRKLEIPEGKRMILNLLEGCLGSGEIKIYRKIKRNLEQLEYAKIENAICEFGETESSEN